LELKCANDTLRDIQRVEFINIVLLHVNVGLLKFIGGDLFCELGARNKGRKFLGVLKF
jgi:hypothetical protein